MRKTACLLFLALTLAWVSGVLFAEELPRLTIFYSPSCHRCEQIKNTVIPGIEKEFQDSLVIEYSDITEIENYQRLLSLRDRLNPEMEIKVPVFLFKGKLFLPRDNAANNLRQEILASLGRPHDEFQVSGADLIERFKGFTPFAVLAAGLIDGINPCAFTVIVFFISFLSLQGYRRRELAAIGSGFILAVFATYLLIGLGLFNFLYRLKGFWMATKILNIGIGAFSILLGAFCVMDLIKYKKTGQTEGLFLQLPQAVKNRIHRVIGSAYRKPGQEKGREGRGVISLTGLAVSTGFLVSILEAVCTGQAYLPTITFILKTTSLKFEAIVYLAAYNLMFILPLGVIFILALSGASSQQFSGFLKKRLLIMKSLMAVLFFGFGAFLIWRA